jgi:type VI secretion system secreted protein VgrG
MYQLTLRSNDYHGTLNVLSCDFHTALMSPGSIVIHAVAEGNCFDALAVPATPMSLTLADDGGFRRHLHGILVTGNEAGWRHGKAVYRLALSSWWSLLRVSRRCRIFQDISIPDIVRSVMAGYPTAQIRFELSGNYDRREYCVQYRETDFDFCHRLLEDVGIFYRIDHQADTHTIVFSDSEHFPSLEDGQQMVPYRPDDEEGRIIRPGIQALDRKRDMAPQRVLVNDYDYHNPGANLQASHGEADNSWYIDTSGHLTPEEGSRRARLRQEATRWPGRVAQGRANFPGLDAGHSFQLQGHPDRDRDRTYQLVAVTASLIADGPDSAGNGFTLQCQFEALDEAIVYRPPCITPKPTAPSLQGAIVVGPPGAEVHTDALARVRVRFHWDNEHDTEEDASCWMRVAQPWAGKGWGSLMLPRVGQEVLVGHIEGDIDRPVVTATVYNAENPPPLDLPAQASQTGFVSRSLDRGQPSHASSVIFDDTRGTEMLKLHAERDMSTSVERSQSLVVGQDRKLDIGRSLTMKTPKSTRTIGEALTRKESSTSWTGSSFSIVEQSMALRGVDVAVKGVDISVKGVAIGVNGSNTSITGVNTSIFGQNTGFTASSISMTGSSVSMTGSSVSMTGSSMSFVGSSQTTTGFSRSVTAMSHSTTVTDLKQAATKSSTAGTESKTRGMQSKN